MGMVRKGFIFTCVALLIVGLSVALFTAWKHAAVIHAAPARPGEPHLVADRAASSSGSIRADAMDTSLFRTIAKRENPVVVSIMTESHVRTPDVSQLFGSDEFFRRFFGAPVQPREEIQRGLGSGFLITSDGEILTNNHVIDGAEQIRVGMFGDERRTYAADVVGRDPLTDSALIRLKNGPHNLPTATLGDSAALKPGDWVMAIGNPFQLGHTVTVGVISYTGRPFAVSEGRYENMLQTDASINPGNSGGPLIDVHGTVVGINSAILSGQDGGGNIGIGFAVPIDTVKALLPQLRHGRVHRSQLGIQIQSAPVTDDEAKALGLPKPEGAIVSMVERDAPADRAGLKAGDVIVEYNGQAVPDAEHLTAMVASTSAGTQAAIVFYRDGKRQTTTATVEELRLDDNDKGEGNHGGSPAGFGLSLEDLTPEIASQLRLSAHTDGALVDGVESFSPAADAGIARGDVILEINRQAVHSAREAERALRQVTAGQLAFLLVSRRGNQVFIEMRKG
jgi:serine protease Do